MLDMEQVAKRLQIAELAIEHHEAQNEARHAQREYHLAWQRFETGDDSHGTGDDCIRPVYHEDRICRNHPQFEAACDATKIQYEDYQAKKRAVYNAKRRLETAIRGAA